MKKVFLAFAVASIFAACSDSTSKTEVNKDSTTVVKDSTAVVAPVVTDSTTKTSDSVHIKVDTTIKK